MIWLVFAALSMIGLLLMGLPLWHRSETAPDTADTTPAVLLDQLDEVKRDLERGVMSGAEANAAEQEIKRRILMQSRKPAQAVNGRPSRGRYAIVLSAVFVPVFAIGYYAVMGSPDRPGITFSERATERQEIAKVEDLTNQLYDRLTSDPEGGPSEGWMLLGQTYASMDRFADAADAFGVVARRPEATSAVFSMLAEALISAEKGAVTPAAEIAIDRAMELGPSNPAAVFYKSVALKQKGDIAQAHDLLVSRLDNADGFYPWMGSFVAQANRIGGEIGRAPISLADFAPMADAPGPTQDDIENAQDLTVEERQAFILSMVERLAARLEEEPDDLDGWLRLGKAYSVLGDREQAIAALERAEVLLSDAPQNDPRREVLQEALARMGK